MVRSARSDITGPSLLASLISTTVERILIPLPYCTLYVWHVRVVVRISLSGGCGLISQTPPLSNEMSPFSLRPALLSPSYFPSTLLFPSPSHPSLTGRSPPPGRSRGRHLLPRTPRYQHLPQRRIRSGQRLVFRTQPLPFDLEA